MMEKEQALERLTESGHQVTPHREYLIELCLENKGHFTADDLYRFDQQKDVRLSRATIYNTLHLLVDIGFLRELKDVDSSSHYEVKNHVHPHARCNSCGELMDIPVDLHEQVDSWNLPFQVEGIRMTVEGFCPECSEEAAA